MRISFRVWILIVCLIFAVLMISPNLRSGVLIKNVERNSSAYENGLRQGMVIKQVNENVINNVDDYSKIISEVFENSVGEKKVDILTDKGEFIFLTSQAPEIEISRVPRTKLRTGLDLSGGARALIKAKNQSLSQSELQDLIAITSQRLNTFGLSDVVVKSVSDLEGNNFMLLEVAGASPSDLNELIGKQGKFEAKIMNQTVFGGGNDDIGSVCRNDAACATITSCSQNSDGTYSCLFRFTVYLTEKAAKSHAAATATLSLDDTGRYLTEKLYLFIDGKEVDSLLIGSELKGQVATEISIQGGETGSTQEEALKNTKASMNKLQTILITGSLPYELEIVKLDSISPMLGAEFTRALLMLGAVAFLIVSVFIFVKYKKIKITLAVILTMFSEALMTLGIAAFIGWNLDAPGIAGIIAGIGTGVNDQIVILDESIGDKKGNQTSGLKERVKRALFIIVGAFLTIVAAMLPLFWAGAGMLKGFALTTIIGVTVGILITRPAFADIIKRIEGE